LAVSTIVVVVRRMQPRLVRGRPVTGCAGVSPASDLNSFQMVQACHYSNRAVLATNK
jgi:hypothetical protein